MQFRLNLRIGILLIAHLTASASRANDEAVPEVRINPNIVSTAVASGISTQTLEEVARAVQEYGVSTDLCDEARFRASITGSPAMIELHVAGMHREHSEREANSVARATLSDSPGRTGTSQPAAILYPLTRYHRAVLGEIESVKGDNENVSLFRRAFAAPAYVVSKTAKGWRVVVTEDKQIRVPVADAIEFTRYAQTAFDQLKQQVIAGEVKRWSDYADASKRIRTIYREQMTAGPTTEPSTQSSTQPSR